MCVLSGDTYWQRGYCSPTLLNSITAEPKGGSPFLGTGETPGKGEICLDLRYRLKREPEYGEGGGRGGSEACILQRKGMIM